MTPGDCAATVERLHATLLKLQQEGALLELAPLEDREWFELLEQKLLPQLKDDAFLVLAVVGGTNIGKSVVFNHLAGVRASATSPLASGTKHPVCLVPPGFEDRHDLEAIFQGFTLERWTTSEAALEPRDVDVLFWRTSDATPENLLVLDTPDIDSDALVNWTRADKIRRSSDVLIALLTQQKYNDAAVKKFFRQAAAEDKAVVIVFNQVQLPYDEDVWPRWLETFTSETGVRPELVYLAPLDRDAAEENRLPFFERVLENDSESSVDPSPPIAMGGLGESRDLADDLSRLKFVEIKVRTLRGSIRQLLDSDVGVPSYLREIVARSGRFQSAAELLAADRLAKTEAWPPIPNKLMVAEIRRWWQAQREGWSASIHGFYNTVGSGLTWPFRFAKEKFSSEETPPLDVYRKQEWTAILKVVESVFDRLTEMSELGNDLLNARIGNMLDGASRTEILARLEAAHAEVDVEQELKKLVSAELETFREDSPQFYTILNRIDKTAALVRPATSVVLFMTGFGPAGDAAAHLAANSAIQSVVHAAGDVAGGTVAAAVGETAISSGASGGMGYVEAKFRRLHARFTGRRVAWLLEQLHTHLWGRLVEELYEGAGVPQSETFREVKEILDVLESQAAEELQESLV